MKRKSTQKTAIEQNERHWRQIWHSEMLVDMLRWLLVVPIVLLVLFLTSTLALAFGMGIETVSSRSYLAADYAPWEQLVVRGVSDGIIAEMKQDAAASNKDVAMRLARFDEPSKEGNDFLSSGPDGSVIVSAEHPTPRATPTATAVASSTSGLFASSTPSPTITPALPSATKTIAPSATASDTPETPIVNAGVTPTPSAGPSYWFYDQSAAFPMTYTMDTHQPQGNTAASMTGMAFLSDPIAAGMQLQPGPGALVVWARSPFMACDVQYTVMAGLSTVASGVLSIPKGSTGAYQYASFNVSQYQFGMDFPIGLLLQPDCLGLEMKWDGAYNDARLELPPILLAGDATITPTKTNTPTPQDRSATQTPTSTAPSPSNTPTATPSATPAASDTPTSGPSVGGNLWFYNSTNPLKYMMQTSQPGGTGKSSVTTERFYSPEYSPGERLSAGTASVTVWAISGFGPCDLPVVLQAGGSTLGAGTIHVDLDGFGKYYTGSFSVQAHTFAAGERLMVRVGPMCFGGEFKWDGNKNQSRLALP